MKTTERMSELGAHNHELIPHGNRGKGTIQEIELCRQMKEDGLAVVKALRVRRCFLLKNAFHDPRTLLRPRH